MGCLPSKDRPSDQRILSLAIAPPGGGHLPDSGPPGLAAPLKPIQLVDPASWPSEAQREAVLRATGVIDTPREPRFTSITSLMGGLFQCPVALITLLVQDRVWFKSKCGPFSESVARHGSWCNWALVPPHPDMVVCEDSSRDARFAASPYVCGPPFIRFYAGAPLLGAGGYRYGTLCVVDLRPRAFSAEMYSLLANFAALAVQELERDLRMSELLRGGGEADIERHERLRRDLSRPTDAALLLDVRAPPWRVLYENDALDERCGAAPQSSVGRPFWERERVEAAVAAGTPARLAVRCRDSGRELLLVLRPASSDMVFPEKAVGVPNWVPSELEAGATRGGAAPAKGALLGPACAPAATTAAVSGGGAVDGGEALPPTSSFCFAVVERGAAPPAAAASASAPAQPALPLAALRLPELPLPGTGAGAAMVRLSETSVLAAAAAAAAIGSAGTSPDATPAPESPGTPVPSSRRSSQALSSPTHTPPTAAAAAEEGGGPDEMEAYGCRRPPPELRGLRLGPLLGMGSYGRVYRAMWRTTPGEEPRAVAVKVVDCRQGSPAAADALHEAALSRGFHHPNVTLLHVRGCANTVWILQELCSHGTLREAAEVGLLRRQRSLEAPPDMLCVLRALREIAAGVAYLHSQGILHRDLTCNNVLLAAAEPSERDPRGWTCRIADFGLGAWEGEEEEDESEARLAVGEAASTSTHGTVTCEGVLHHMPPELLAEGLLTPAADVWSFGVIAWESYCGVRAYLGLPAPTIIFKVINGSSPLVLPPCAPPPFRALVDACLARDRTQRPSFPKILATLNVLLAQEEALPSRSLAGRAASAAADASDASSGQ